MYAVSLPSKVHAPAPTPVPRPSNRSQGRARISFALRGGRTALHDLYQEGCLRLVRPQMAPGAAPQAVLLNTAGGITGGDSLDVSVHVGSGAGAVLTSQAAERIYRSAGGDGIVRTTLSVDTGGWLAWLPQETILFNGGRIDRETKLAAAAGSRLLACESIVFGRQARRESVREGLLRDSWRLLRDGKLVWADFLHLEDDIATILARPATADGAVAIATVLFVADNALELLDTAREMTGAAHVTAAATAMGSILLARFAADSVLSLRQDLMPFLTLILEAARIPATLPTVWTL